MSQFKLNLLTLPSIEGILRLTLSEADKEARFIGEIENKPGKTGSLAVYHFLALEYGDLTAEAAKAGLALFAEHVESAQEQPGAHPNIDLLLDVVDKNRVLSMRIFKNED